MTDVQLISDILRQHLQVVVHDADHRSWSKPQIEIVGIDKAAEELVQRLHEGATRSTASSEMRIAALNAAAQLGSKHIETVKDDADELLAWLADASPRCDHDCPFDPARLRVDADSFGPVDGV